MSQGKGWAGIMAGKGEKLLLVWGAALLSGSHA